MISLDPTSSLDHFESFVKPKIVRQVIQDACENIAKKGESTFYSDIYDALVEYINDNIEKFIEERSYDIE